MRYSWHVSWLGAPKAFVPNVRMGKPKPKDTELFPEGIASEHQLWDQKQMCWPQLERSSLHPTPLLDATSAFGES